MKTTDRFAFSSPLPAKPTEQIARGRQLHPDLEAVRRLVETAHSPWPHYRGGWSKIVADALYLIDGGHAAQALALGWTLHDLFGAEPFDSDEFEQGWDLAGEDGLAFVLKGAAVLRIFEETALVLDDAGHRRIYKGGQGTILMWLLPK